MKKSKEQRNEGRNENRWKERMGERKDILKNGHILTKMSSRVPISQGDL